MSFCECASPARGSHIYSLKYLQASIGAGKWLDDDVDFLSESVKGLLGIAGAQLLGMGRLVSHGEPVQLHPLVTLLRGVAEACGTISWLVSPWLDAREDEEESEDPADWWNSSQPVLARIELLELEARMSRVHRLRAAFTDDQPSLTNAEALLEDLRQKLVARHGSDNATVRGSRKDLKIEGESMPAYTELVTMATEFSHGAKYRGTGMNPYPMLSGFAHANVEILFSQPPTYRRPGMSGLYSAQVGEVRDLMALGCRLVETHYEITAKCLGTMQSELTSWTEAIRDFIEATVDLE